MKNTILWGALFTLICTQAQADVNPTPSQPAPQTPTVSTPNNPTTPASATTPPAAQPSATTPSQPTTVTQPAPQTPGQEVLPVPAQPAPVINCDYKIPAQTKTIDQSIVTTWAQNATVQIFDFNPTTVDSQVQKLQACFTEQGWTGFNAALQKSGNVEAIKSQKLTVSSQVDGTAQVTEAKDNQWKITLPLQVVYQNDKEKVTQLLDIKLTIGRKISGDLGITQMIAAPRPTETQPTVAPATPASSNAAPANTNTPTSTPPSTATPPNGSTPGNSAPSTSTPPDAVNQPGPQAPGSSQPNQ